MLPTPAAPAAVPAPLPRRLLPPLATFAGIAAAFSYVGLVDPNETGHYPLCPMYAVTGLYCPGCGGLRSAHAFIHGDLATAFGDNALAVVGYVLFAAVWVIWLVRARKAQPVRLVLPTGVWWSLGAVILVFTLLRNLPFGSALAP